MSDRRKPRMSDRAVALREKYLTRRTVDERRQGLPRITSDEWKEMCMEERGKILTGAMSHWCHDWDGLTVDETTIEYEMCDCDIERRRKDSDE